MYGREWEGGHEEVEGQAAGDTVRSGAQGRRGGGLPERGAAHGASMKQKVVPRVVTRSRGGKRERQHAVKPESSRAGA